MDELVRIRTFRKCSITAGRTGLLLAPIYNWFTEGFEAPDVIDAKALLDELS